MAVAFVTETHPPVAVDARPIVPRNETNLWTQAETIRDQLYNQIAGACRSSDIEALLLKSGSYVFPAFVQFEAWQPQENRGTTRRSWATVTIEPKPFHTHPFEFEVTYGIDDKKGTVRRVQPLEDAEVHAFVKYLLAGGSRPKFRRFRETTLQFWREKNELEGLRSDILVLSMTMLIVLGLMSVVLLPLALVFWGTAAFLYMRIRRRRTIVRNDGKPDGEPRTLVRVDSWQTVLFTLGHDEAMVKDRFIGAIQTGLGPHCKFRAERWWYWGVDGKEEREQFVLTGGRGIVFCQIYRYGEDLYVGWDGHLNRGQWVEQTVASGIERGTGNPIRISRVVPGVQPTSEYDLADLSCLMEWTHAQLVKLLKQLMAEKRIDQEIDFKIQRAERRSVAASGAAAAEGGVAGKGRKAFQRTA